MANSSETITIKTKEDFDKILDDGSIRKNDIFIERGVVLNMGDNRRLIKSTTFCNSNFFNTFLNYDFYMFSFRQQYMSGGCFTNCRFINGTFENGNFINSKFKDCVFRNVKFTNCLFAKFKFVNCNFDHCSFFMCSFNNYKEHTIFKDCNFIGDFLLSVQACRFISGRIVSNCENMKQFLFEEMICHNDASPKIYSFGPIGSRGDFTIYIPEINWVKCGCWRENKGERLYTGGSLEAFEKQVIETYPEGRYHDEYMTLINLFKVMKANDKKE